jgi:hypothetical protein
MTQSKAWMSITFDTWMNRSLALCARSTSFEHPDPLGSVAIARDDRRCATGALDEELIDVLALLAAHRLRSSSSSGTQGTRSQTLGRAHLSSLRVARNRASCLPRVPPRARPLRERPRAPRRSPRTWSRPTLRLNDSAPVGARATRGRRSPVPNEFVDSRPQLVELPR